MSTKEQRDRVRNIAYRIHNSVYDDVEWHDDFDDPMDIHVNSLSSREKIAHWGQSGYGTDHEVNLGIKWDAVGDMNLEQQIGILFHEVTHERFRKHDHNFIRRMAQNFRQADYEWIEELVGDVHWTVVKYFLFFDARHAVEMSLHEQTKDKEEMETIIRDAFDIDRDVAFVRRRFTIGGDITPCDELPRRYADPRTSILTEDLEPVGPRWTDADRRSYTAQVVYRKSLIHTQGI